MKLNLDGTYHDHIESQYKKLKNLKLVVRQQLLKSNDDMEFDEYREKVEVLKQLVEAYKVIRDGEEPGSQTESEDDY